MASKLRHLRSSVPGKIPAPEQLELGQLALNTADGKVYLKKSDGTVSDITKEIFQNETKVTVNDAGDSTLAAITFDISSNEVARFADNILQFFEELAIEDGNKLTLKEQTSAGADGVSIKSPDSLASSYTLTLPPETGTQGQVLITNGLGQLSFRDSDIYGGNRIYVSEERGNDINDGQSAPVKTVKRALQLASGLVYNENGVPNGKKIAIQVAAGDYSEANPLIVPDNVIVKGDGLRSCIIRPLNAGKDMLRVRNGCYFAEFTFRDSVDENFVPQFTFDYAVTFDDPTDATTSRVGYTNLPATRPTITTSPYIQNCSLISFLAGNGVKIDGSLVNSPNTSRIPIESENPVSGPLPEQGKSMVSNAFTMLSFGGTGWRVINNAYSQIVSCFQIFMLNGVYTQSGGYVSITNSATNFGLYSLRSSGYNPGAFIFDRGYIVETGSSGAEQTLSVIGLGRNEPVEEFVVRFRDPEYKYAYDILEANKPTIVDDVITWVNSQITGNISPFTSSFVYDETTWRANLALIIDAVAFDVYSGGNSKSVEAGLSYYIGTTITIPGEIDETIASIDYAKSLSQTAVATKTSLSTYTGGKFDIITNIIDDINTTPDIIDFSSISDITNTYKPITDDLDFDAAVDLNATTDIFTIIDHGFNNGDAVIYDPNGNDPIGGLDAEQTYYIKLITTDEFSLAFDDSLEFDVDILSVSTGTHKLIKDTQEFYVNEIIESHSVYQELTLAAGTYNFTPGKLITGTTTGNANSAYVYNYNPINRTLIVSINNVTIGSSTIRNQFDATSIISQDHTSPTPVTSISVTGTAAVVGKGTARFTVLSTSTGGQLTTTDLEEKQIWFHRPSVVNSSAHTWEYAGSGTDYNALPQNGGNTRERFEQFAELPGRVYTSGTNELGDFKVGDFITAFNRTGNITFRNKVTVDELDALRLSVSDVVISEISTNVNLGDDEIGGASHTRLSTQLAIRSFLSNRLGNFIDKNVSTNAVPGSLVQLNTNGQINEDLIPATRAFQSTVTQGYRSKLLQVDFIPPVDLSAGDIATEEYQQVELNLDGAVSGNDGDIVLQATSGATGYLKGNYSSSLNILVASFGGTFDIAFNTTNSLSIDGTPTGVIPTSIEPISDIIENFFLKTSNESQFLNLDVSETYSFTNAAISTVARSTNVATIVTVAAHGLTATSHIKITCSNGSFDDITHVTVVNSTTFSYDNVGSDVSTVSATGTVNSVVTAADTGAQGEVTETQYGVLSNVDNINITGGTLYTPGTGTVVYENVALTTVSGSGTGARADITVVNGSVTDVDLIRGGTGYQLGDDLSASSSNIGGTGSGFEITVLSIEKRVYIDILGGELFVASAGSIDFIQDNNANDDDITLTDSIQKTFNAATDVNTTDEIITVTGHGFTSGDPVTYISAPNTPVGGLLNGSVYYVNVLTIDTIELYEDYSLINRINLSSTSIGSHSLTRYVVNIIDNSIVIESHGYTTGDAVLITGLDLPTIEGVQIPNTTTGRSYFVGSITTNSFTLHSLRSDALSSINGLVINSEDIESTGSGSANFLRSNVRVFNIVNTSSRNDVNWNSLAVTNIDAGNIISGTISTSRLASSGTANTDTFLRGDSSWSVAVQTLSENADSPLTLTGPNLTGNYYGNVVLDIERVNTALGDSLYTNTGVAKFLKSQFFVGTGISQGEVYIKDGVVDAGTLDTFDSSYFLNPANLTSAVPVSRGGTNLSSYNTGDIIYAQTAGTLGTLSIGRPDSILVSSGTAPSWRTRLDVPQDIMLASGKLSTDSNSTGYLFNENLKSLNIGNSTTSVSIGSNSANDSLSSVVSNYEAATSPTVTVNLASFNLTTNASSNNGSYEIRFTSTSLIKIGHVVTGSASIQANSTVVGFTSNSIYIDQPLVGTIASITSLTFSETPVSIGVKIGDQITISSSGITNLDGTWSVTGATESASSFTIRTTNNVTAAQITQVGTVVKESSFLIRNKNLTIGSSEAGSTPVSALIKGENGVGTNIEGGDLVFQPGLSTGNANGGDFVVKTGAQNSSGTAQQPTTTRLTIDNKGNSVFTTAVEVQNTVKANHSTGITTNQTVFPLVNTTATTVNFAGAATTLEIASSSGTTNINNNLVVDLDLQVKGGDVTTTATTFNLVDATATTVNFARASTSLVMGATTGTTTVRNKLLVNGDLQVDGTTFTVNSTQVSIDDPIFNIGGDTAPILDDNKDRGISFQWYQSGAAKVGFFGFDDSKNAFTFVPDATISGEIVSGTVGQVYVGSINLNDHCVITTTETIGITSAAASPIDVWAASTYRTGKYTLQVTCTAGGDANSYQTSEILVIHNGSTSTLTDYAVIRTGNNLVTFTTDISGGNVRLLAQATAGNTIKVKLTRTIQTI
jgi:hypothetical protein